LAWQELEFIAFFHFGVNTFTDREWGDGGELPEVFDPSALDTRQWIRTIREAGMKLAILTAKHHDGFCLWPSEHTEHSVKNSSYRNGKGDVVREFVDACREFEVKAGIYLSPWDRHERTYGSDAYNDHFKCQLAELLTGYGPIHEVWFDGACGEGPNGRRQVYDWRGYHTLIRKRMPEAVIAIMGPDVRWVGNEDGLARESEWSVVPTGPPEHDADAEEDILMPQIEPTASDVSSREGILRAEGIAWYPAECDVSIRPGWFYHADQDDRVKSPEELIDIYYRSVGRNSVLLLNIPPDKRGVLHENDIASLREMRRILDATFAENLLTGASASASHIKGNGEAFGAARTIDGIPDTYWTTDDGQETAALEYDLGSKRTFDLVMLQEHIRIGQRIEEFSVKAWNGTDWAPVSSGTTVGYKRLLRCGDTTARKVRICIEAARLAPTLSNVGLFRRR